MAETALETGFPSGVVSAAAEKEAWRKEVHRPASHTHKWWAQRLGSVFRGILASALASDEEEAIYNYSSRLNRPDITVLDPFAGSGTTLVEAAKMGCRVVGYDINPVATLVQRQAISRWDENLLLAAYKEVESVARKEIDELHVDSKGRAVLYYFWVGVAPCPLCPPGSQPVKLFSRYIFAQHAYPKKFPAAKATCPQCMTVVDFDLAVQSVLRCPNCDWSGDVSGPVSGAHMTCQVGHRVKVIDALKGSAPDYRMYAKLVLDGGGRRLYEAIDQFDLELYDEAERRLQRGGERLVLPRTRLDSGYNTKQAISWGFREWSQFFNARQLYSLGVLGGAVRDLPASPEREALVTLFSGVLEFNNLFCSYKGEGTGAVRHMFSHHVLKPERTPLEAHPWGTPASSGSFSTLFKSRIMRAHEYKSDPHDIVHGERSFGKSSPLALEVTQDYATFAQVFDSALVVSASAAEIDMPDGSVDLVISDPPYFDNVHYSELADFFHAWLRELRPYDEYPVELPTTRRRGEVQSTEAQEFSDSIAAVWAECCRVLKDTGLVAFTYHQARVDGWIALVCALRSANLVITAIQPVKGEMSVAAPKSGAADPSNLDSVVVCRKSGQSAVRPSLDRTISELKECVEHGVTVGWTDVQSVIRGTVLSRHTDPSCEIPIDDLLEEASRAADAACVELGVTSRRIRSR